MFLFVFSPTVGWAPADGACSSAALRLQLVIPPLSVGLSVSEVCGHGSHTPLWCSADCNTLHYIQLQLNGTPTSRHLCLGPHNIHAAPPKHATMLCHARRHKKSHRGMQAPSMQACRTCSRCPPRHLLRPAGAPWISTYKRSMMPKGIIFSYWAIHPAAGPAAGPTGT